jgi:hypothetical protein
MTLHSSVRFNNDDGQVITLTAGLIADLDPANFSPEERERQRVASEREQRQLEAEEEARLADESPDRPPWMVAERHTVAEKLAQVAAAADREDRREAAKAAQAHIASCGCSDCQWREPGAVARAPKRLPAIEAKKLAEAQDAFLEQPATVGSVAHLAADVNKKFGAIARLLKTGKV